MAGAARPLGLRSVCTDKWCRSQVAEAAKPDDHAMPHDRRIRDEIRRGIETLPQALTGDRP